MFAAHANLLTVDQRQHASADNGLPADTGPALYFDTLYDILIP